MARNRREPKTRPKKTNVLLSVPNGIGGTDLITFSARSRLFYLRTRRERSAADPSDRLRIIIGSSLARDFGHESPLSGPAASFSDDRTPPFPYAKYTPCVSYTYLLDVPAGKGFPKVLDPRNSFLYLSRSLDRIPRPASDLSPVHKRGLRMYVYAPGQPVDRLNISVSPQSAVARVRIFRRHFVRAITPGPHVCFR